MGSTLSLEDTTREMAKQCNNTHFLIVDGMSKLLNGKVPKCRSSDFHAFGITWSFHLFTGEEKDYLSFSLLMAEPTSSIAEVECTFKLGAVSRTDPPVIHQVPTKEYFEGKGALWGWPKFATHKALKERFIVDDKAVFCVEITDVNPKSAIVNPTKGTVERLKLMEIPRNNSRFTWHITRFSSLNSKSSSYEFTVEQHRWKLEMYPKGDTSGVGHISVYLTATDYLTNSPKSPTVAFYKLRVRDQLNLKHHESKCEGMFSNSAPTWGISKFLPLDELRDTSRGFRVNDEIYIGIEFITVYTHEVL